MGNNESKKSKQVEKSHFSFFKVGVFGRRNVGWYFKSAFLSSNSFHSRNITAKKKMKGKTATAVEFTTRNYYNYIKYRRVLHYFWLSWNSYSLLFRQVVVTSKICNLFASLLHLVFDSSRAKKATIEIFLLKGSQSLSKYATVQVSCSPKYVQYVLIKKRFWARSDH